ELGTAGLENLPAALDTPPDAEQSVIYLANGEPLAVLYQENRIPVTLAEISPYMKAAQLAIEDHRFYEHGAIDLKGTLRAFARNTAGGSTQGGSTLTQQYVKQVQVAAAAARGDQEAVLEAQAPTYERKIREMRYAIAVEKKYSKDEILERYLNIAYYGYGAYGVEVAARRYFGTTAAQLTLSQAAMIAGIVQNPNIDPWRRPEQALERRNVVLNRMAELGMAQQEEVDLAKAEGFDRTKVQHPNQGCSAPNVRYPFMCDYVVRTLLNNPALGGTLSERQSAIMRGGLRVWTKIDPGMMDAAQKRLSALVAPTDPVISTMVMVQPGTGLILAMAQNRPVMGGNAAVGETSYNYAVEAGMGGAEGYQAGSTFKTFTVANALNRGISPSTRFQAPQTMEFRGRKFLTCDSAGNDIRFTYNAPYSPHNSTGAFADIDMYKATEMSVNTYFIQLEQVAGICQSARMADMLGVKLSSGKSLESEYAWYPSFTLGIAEVSPLSMATAYATLAARGVRCDPIIVERVTTRTGAEVETPGGNCRQVLDPQVADGVNEILSRVMTNGTGRGVRTADGRPQAGKTGTTDSNAAVWFAGYTPNLAGIAMIAVDKNPRYQEFWAKRGGSLQGLRMSTPARMELNGSGSGDAGRIWTPVMEAALESLPKVGFTAPSARVTSNQGGAPSVGGMSYPQARQALQEAGYTVVQRSVSSSRPRGTWLGTYRCSGKVCYMDVSSGARGR
ncbi:MAG: transglycosylase domain-containing protein, partial [Actinomycetia bacterium]|nr:transglycosylase domain-containing protein [Actinomycetes bacterium]